MNQWKVCAVTSRQGKVREARSKPAAARIVPFHAGASTCRNNTVFHSPTGLYAAGFGLSASVPYLSLVTCHVKGKRRYFLSAPRFHSARSKFRRGTDKENPFHVCPGRPLPDPPKPHSFLLHFLLHLYPARPYPLLPSYFPDRSRLFSAVAVRFSNCKGRLPRLIRRLEVHSLQILPFHESVIGRETRRMKPCRQPCSASVKSRNGSDREKNRKKGKKADVSRHKRQVMDKKNCKTGKRMKRQVEKILMVIDVKREIIDILQITNRRFMYNPQTGTLILGDEIYGKTICSSHSQEFHASRAEGCFDDYLRGWIGTSKSYPHGIIHFAPAVIMEQFDRGFDALQMFAGLEGVNGDTIIRGFCGLPEQRMSDLLPSSF